MRTPLTRPRALVGRLALIAFGFIALFASQIKAEDLKTSPEAAVFFEAKVRPVLVESCLKCHGSKKQSG